MRIVRDLDLNTLAVSPDATFQQALEMMVASGQTAAAVMEGREFRGVVTVEAAVLSDADAPVSEAMQGRRLDLDPEEPVRAAAKAFVDSQSSVAAVFEKGKFLGLLSPLALLVELGRSWDPMTGLSWSDLLRDWGIEQLEDDREITVVLFDIDDFGKFNKKHGHVVGDKVVCAVADLLKRTVDPALDLLVRYAGDEFVVATLRNRGETEALARKIAAIPVSVAGLTESVTVSFGVSGGKRASRPGRTTEDSRTHAQSTLDNLINLASKAMTVNKLAKKAGTTAQSEGQGGIRVSIESTEPVVATVEATSSGRSGVGTAFKGKGPLAMAIARATVEALTADTDARIRVDDVFFHLGEDDGKLVTMVGRWAVGLEERSIGGTVAVGPDADLSVALATAAALEPVIAAGTKTKRV